MTAVNVILLASAFGFVVMTLWYCLEAARQSLLQGLLVLVIPLYSLHFAYIRSQKGMAARLVLAGCAAVYLLTSAGRLLISQAVT